MLSNNSAEACSTGFSIGRNHPFADGNKRTTLASMLMFLIKNNWKIEYSQSDAETLILSIACGTCSREEIATWIVERTIRGSDSSGDS